MSASVNPLSERCFSELSLLLLDAGDQLCWKYSLVQQGGIFRVEPRVNGKVARLKRWINNYCGKVYDLKQHTMKIIDRADKKLQEGRRILEEDGDCTPELIAELTSAVSVLHTLPQGKDITTYKARLAKAKVCEDLVEQLHHLRVKKIAKDNHLSLRTVEAREKAQDKILALHEHIDLLTFIQKCEPASTDSNIARTRKLQEYKALLKEISRTKWKNPISFATGNYLPKNRDSLSYDAKMHLLFADSAPKVPVHVSKPKNVMDLFAKLLRNHEGICIGEQHDERISEYLCEHMKQLQEMGVRTLFTEQFYYTQQHSIDAYLATGDIQHAKNSMRRPYADQPWQAFEYHHNLLEAARKQGIRVVGIDSRTASENEALRLVEMNYIAYRVIEKEKQPGKFIALVGANHLTTFDRGAIPGLSELTRTPAIELYHTEMSARVRRYNNPYERTEVHAVATLYKGAVMTRRELQQKDASFAAQIKDIKEEKDESFALFSSNDYMTRKLLITLNEPQEKMKFF